MERREGARLAVKFSGYRTTWTVDLNKHEVRVREQEQEQEHGQEQEQEGDLVNLAAYEREEEEPDEDGSKPEIKNLKEELNRP